MCVKCCSFCPQLQCVSVAAGGVRTSFLSLDTLSKAQYSKLIFGFSELQWGQRTLWLPRCLVMYGVGITPLGQGAGWYIEGNTTRWLCLYKRSQFMQLPVKSILITSEPPYDGVIYCTLWSQMRAKWIIVNTLRPRQDGLHFSDDIFNCIFLNENV